MDYMDNAQVPDAVTIDGMSENQFRTAIEAMLREGRADEAARRIKDELVFLCGEGLPLPARFRFIASQDVIVTGWDRLIRRIAELDRPGDPVTAIAMDICPAIAAASADPGRPFYETAYYTDRAWPFSTAGRSRLAQAFAMPEVPWQGAFEDNDDTLGVTGLEDLHAVIAAMRKLCTAGMATAEEQRACTVGACHLAVLTHQALRDKAMAEGLPRPMAVLVGGHGGYPAFEAAALAAVTDERWPEGAPDGQAAAPAPSPFPAPSFPAPPFPAPPLAADAPDGGPPPRSAAPGDDAEAWHLPPPGIHVTGTQLRRQLVTRESIAALENEAAPSLLQTLANRLLTPFLRKK
ncbi:hypothetical protein [Novosphingobium sp. ST904]|uniref:hypothetical protein n=1 Tax=Novosphingobium sp. ST904 TaxID=1684385 RepID=UPI000B32374B|nr:hypothetical protein [Novosphingobium sp. ST904]TCM40054.1 hypothetical protein EDF59_105293 [Novosphingobium sp. ST904]